MFKSLRELVSNPSPEGILSAARNAVAELTHRQDKQQIQRVVKLTPNRFDKMLKLDNLKNVSCHAESIEGAPVYHSVYIAGHLSLVTSKDEKFIRILSSKLDTLISSMEERALSEDGFASLMHVVASEPDYETIHLAAACGFFGFLKAALEKDRQVVLGFATQDGDFPIHIAAKWGQVEAVRLLIENGGDLCQRDAMGRTVVHWAAAHSASTLKDLSNETSFSNAVAVQDESGMSPLALAIREANFESAKILMGTAATTIAEASPLLTVLSGMEYSEALGNCLELVITINPSVVEQVDEKGRCVLHLQLDKMVLMKVLKHSFQNVNLNIQDTDGQTPLHLAVIRGDIGCVVALLSYGADVNAPDKNGANSLMKAVQVASLDLVKLLLLFEADLKAVNAQGQSVYEVNKSSKRRADIDLLLAVMDPSASTVPARLKTPWDYQQEMAIKAQKESSEANGQRLNLLSLDGGGIRGVVVIQMLSELERKLGADFLSYFGWLGGTSTGAILALALSQGKSIAYCRAMYFRLKDELFCGKRPYSSVLLDSFLRFEFGESTTMADVKAKKVMATTCLANVCPPQLKLLRNYQLQLSDEENKIMGFVPPESLLVREAARSSSAAPTYFPPFDNKYVDGGLLANNPCPQLISDVQLMNTSAKMAGKPEQCFQIGCVVSLGTGRIPDAAVESLDLSVPTSFMEFATNLQNNLSLISHLKNLLLDQIGRADGIAVDCSRAWSHSLSAPFFRYSPKMYCPVDLDETDDIKLINIMWDAKVYMKEETGSVEQLVDLLKSFV